MKKILLTLLTVLSLSNFNSNAFNASEIKDKAKKSYNNSLNFIKKHKKAAAGITVAAIATPSLSWYLLKNKNDNIVADDNEAILAINEATGKVAVIESSTDETTIEPSLAKISVDIEAKFPKMYQNDIDILRSVGLFEANALINSIEDGSLQGYIEKTNTKTARGITERICNVVEKTLLENN